MDEKNITPKVKIEEVKSHDEFTAMAREFTKGNVMFAVAALTGSKEMLQDIVNDLPRHLQRGQALVNYAQKLVDIEQKLKVN
jgi:hypothetical protein